MTIFSVNTSNKQKKIITIPTNCAFLQSYDDYNYFYNIQLSVDPLVASQTGAFLIKIFVLSQNSDDRTIKKLFSNKTPGEMVENLRAFQPLIKDISNSFTKPDPSMIIGKYTISKPPIIDISSFISNKNTKLLKNNIPIQRINSVISTRQVEEINNINLSTPISSININNPAIPIKNGVFITNSLKVSQQMNELLIEGNVDPASTLQKTNTYVSLRKTRAGVKPPNPYTTLKQFKNDFRKLNIISSILNTSFNTKTNPQTTQDAPNKEYVQVVEYITTKNITVNKIINIPKIFLGKNNFTLRFEVCNTQGKIFQIEETSVQHGINISNIMPSTPPRVNKIGIGKQINNTFEITQNDPYAAGVLIYRKLINPCIMPKDNAYILVSKIPISFLEKKIYKDISATSINNYIYRFVPYTSEDIKSSVFTSVAVKMERNNILNDEKYKRYPSYGAIVYDILQNGINLNIRNYNPNAISLTVYRRNMTAFQRKRNIVGNFFLRNINSNQGVNFIDIFVKKNNTYEYSVDIMYPDGITQTLNNVQLIEYKPVIENSAICQITDAVTVEENGQLDVKFNVVYKIQQNSFELFRKSLQEQNLLAEYQSDISLEKKYIQSFLSYSVLRTNTTTGEVDNFGIVPSVNFSDRVYGATRGIRPVRNNNVYKYTVTVYSRPPDTLFENLERTVTTNTPSVTSNSNTGQNIKSLTSFSYKYKPFKWLEPYVLNTGTFYSKDKHAEDILALGNITDIQTLNITLQTEQVPTIAEIVATQMRKNLVMIEWKVNGDLFKIDHFIVKANVFNNSNIIATCHSFSDTNRFKFSYSLSSEEAGLITFSIIPVYYNYTLGSEVFSNQMVI